MPGFDPGTKRFVTALLYPLSYMAAAKGRINMEKNNLFRKN